MKGAIVLTRVGANGASHPGLRIRVAHIVAYYPSPGDIGANLITIDSSDDDWWVVVETCEEIDALIGGAE